MTSAGQCFLFTEIHYEKVSFRQFLTVQLAALLEESVRISRL